MLQKNSNLKLFLEKNYSNLGNIKKINVLSHHNINSLNFYIKTKNSNFILHKVLDGSNRKRIEQMCKILNYCKRKKFLLAEPIKNNEGYYCKNKIYLTKFYEGLHFNNSVPQLKDTAKNIAKLHKILSSVSIHYNYRPKQNFYKILNQSEFKRIEIIIKRKKKISQLDKTVLSNLPKLINFSKKYGNYYSQIKNLDFSKQLVHGDLNPGNIIFKKNRVTAILDFNQMHKGFPIEDLAFASIRFSIQKNSNLDEIEKRTNLFLNTYLIYNKIQNKQLEYLPYFFGRQFLEGINFIIRQQYFFKSKLWSIDFQKNLKFLEISEKLSKKLL